MPYPERTRRGRTATGMSLPSAPPMAAIANAIHDATGMRMVNLPMNPGAVLEALWEQNGG